MKNQASSAKKSNDAGAGAAVSSRPGENAAALNPPAYGIDFVDSALPSSAPVQREVEGEPEEMEDEIVEGPAQLRTAGAQLQPVREEEEERKSVQGKFDAAPAQRRQAAPESASSRTGMPPELRTGIESLSGMDMSAVRVNFNSPKPAQLNALAYAQGNDIHLAPGQEQHLPHEAWHVVQQRQGRVQPTFQTKGVGINDDHRLEREADVMGARASRQGAAQRRARATGQAPGGAPIVQRTFGVVGENDFDTTKTIGSYTHNRKAVHQWARNRAWQLGPFSQKPDGEVCNHHWGYAQIQADFLNGNVIGRTFKNAAKNTLLTYGAFGDLNAAKATYRNTMIQARDTATVPRAALTKAMNYYITKICDYPENLFFWPDKTDTEPDWPDNYYRDADLPADWDYDVYVTSVASAKATRQTEWDRIAAGKTAIGTAIA